MKTNYQKKNVENNDRVDVNKIIEAGLPVALFLGMGLSTIFLKKLHVPSKLICSMAILVLKF